MFGYFENVQKVPFSRSNSGVFRNAIGNPPFYNRFQYTGQYLFSSDESFIVDTRRLLALPMQPLVLWNACQKHVETESANGHCYIFDKADSKQRTYLYNAVRYSCSITANPAGALSPIAIAIEQMIRQDPKVEFVRLDALEEIQEITSIPGS
jgi:hypothetical protein